MDKERTQQEKLRLMLDAESKAKHTEYFADYLNYYYAKMAYDTRSDNGHSSQG